MPKRGVAIPIVQDPIEDDSFEVPKPPPTLSDEEVELFSLVSTGKVEKVKEFVRKNSGRDFSNVLDEHGFTIFHTAIHRQDHKMVDYLLTLPNVVNLYDLLLHSIREQNKSIMTSVLNALEATHQDSKIYLSTLARWEHSEFSKDITPIILSAQIGNYNLIKYFHERDPKETFEPKYALIDSDTPTAQHIPLKLDISQNYCRLHEFEARASPEMLCYKTNTEENFDPIYEGFLLIEKLKEVANQEHEFRSQYLEIKDRLSSFLISYLDECKTTDDMKLLLRQKHGYEGKNDKYPRLMFAISIDFEEFVIHCHCQKLLYMQWVGDTWPAWRSMGTWGRLFQILLRFFTAPFICLWLYIDFFSKSSKFFRSPVNRCIHHFVSYVYFMGILAVEAVYYTTEDRGNVHDTPCKLLEAIIFIFVCGHTVSLVRHWLLTPKAFFSERWNLYDLITFFCFLVTFGCWGLTWYNESVEPLGNSTPRAHWLYDDPVLLGEAAFALSLVLSYGGFMRFFQLNYLTGPMQVAMGSMIQDISVFVFFFAITMLSFGLGFYFLYSPFAGLSNEIDGTVTTMSSAFTSYPNTLHSLYWSLIGMGDADAAELISFNNNQTLNPEGGDHNSLHITEGVGKGLWICYHLLGAVILMNMLTGYMGNTFSRISDNMISTWKFNRTQVWIYYIRNTVMPSPFNIIPALRDFSLCCKWCTSRNNSDKISKCSLESCCYLEDREDRNKGRYNDLMKRLTQRYLRSKLSVNETDVATNEDVENIMEDINELKARLTLVLKPNLAESSQHWNDERLQGYYKTDASYNTLQWTTKPRPVPSTFRQSFTPTSSRSGVQLQ